jgi:hypothetical protein
MQELIDNATKIKAQLTFFFVDLALFFNSRENMEQDKSYFKDSLKLPVFASILQKVDIAQSIA